MLEDLTPAPKIAPPNDWRPAVEFDGTNGEATTRGFLPDEQPNFDEFLVEAGFDPALIEIVGEPRTSRWQVARPFPLDPQWLTAYRFRFKKRTGTNPDLPLLFAQAKKTRPKTPKATVGEKVFIACLADFQVGKVDYRGGSAELVQRVLASYDRIEEQLKVGKYGRIYALDLGDIIEGIENAANMSQLQGNDLSVMQQVDLAASLVWEFLKMATKYAPVTYASIGSNHCQWRVSKQVVGKPGRDDWGIVILQQLRRLATEVGLPVDFLIPHEQEESLIFDAFGDGFHLVGIAHGHQFSRPENAITWWRQNTFGNQTVSAASMLLTAHFHHLRVVEAGQSHNGGSRFWVQATTSDNGSSWFKRVSGEDSVPGITCLELTKGRHYQGAVLKL
jgi:hypothetical protein